MSDIGAFPAGIDPALIHLTGTIVTWWGRVEGILVNDLIILRQEPECAAIAAKELFPVQTGIIIKQWARLQRLHHAGDAERLAKLEEIVDEMVDAADERNILVHYFWPYGADENESSIRLVSIKPRKGDNATLEIKECFIDVEKLNELNKRLVRLYHAVMADSFNLSWKTGRRKFARLAKDETEE